MMNKKNISNKIYLGIIVALIYIPMISMIIFSFNKGKSLIKWTGFSFD